MTDDLELRLRSAMEDAARTLHGSAGLERNVRARADARARRRVRAVSLASVGLVVALAGSLLVVASDDRTRRVRTVNVPTTEVTTPPTEVTTPEVTASTSAPPTSAPPPTSPPALGGSPGALGPSFGGDGKVTTFFRVAGQVGGTRVTVTAVDGQGRLVAAGGVQWGDESEGGAPRLVLARYLPDGALDASFGDGGRLVTDIEAGPSGLFVLPDAKLLVTATGLAGDNSRSVQVLARFRPDGTSDDTFGKKGRVTVACAVEGGCPGGKPVRQRDGRFVVATAEGGEETGRINVIRFDVEGRLDPAYGDGGVARVGPGEPTGLALDGEERAVVTGVSPAGALVVRLTRTGTVDASFGDGGKVVTNLEREFASFTAVSMLPDGRILVAGSRGESDGSEIVLVRLMPNGQRDRQFGSGGMAVTERPSGRAYPLTLLGDPEGNAVIAGVDGPAMMVARYDASGRLDTRFGQRGLTQVRFDGEGPDGALQMIRLGDGRLMIAGYAFSAEENYGFGLARLAG